MLYTNYESQYIKNYVLRLSKISYNEIKNRKLRNNIGLTKQLSKQL